MLTCRGDSIASAGQRLDRQVDTATLPQPSNHRTDQGKLFHCLRTTNKTDQQKLPRCPDVSVITHRSKGTVGQATPSMGGFQIWISTDYI